MLKKYKWFERHPTMATKIMYVIIIKFIYICKAYHLSLKMTIVDGSVLRFFSYHHNNPFFDLITK